MSRNGWIDELFRRRLEHREFPVESGELEEMRALIDLRNASKSAGHAGGSISRWWLTAIVPLAAAFVWWSVSEKPSPRIVEQSGSEQVEFQEPSAGTRSIEEIGISPVRWTATLVERQSVSDQAHPDPSSTTPAAIAANATSDVYRSRSIGTARNTSGSVDQLPGSSDMRVLNDAIEGMRDDALVDADRVREVDFIVPMVTRWSLAPEPVAASVVRRDVVVNNRRARGELHVFAAPLGVKTNSQSGMDGTINDGSLYGLEYRVRAKYFSVATGIHYGTYGLQAGNGVADVKLNYVEVPVLAGVELGFKRFGLLVQGGMSLDFLFDQGGRYPIDDARTGSGFPDDAFTTMNYSWMLRPQVAYCLDERISLSAGPVWKAQLGSVADQGLLKDARATATGISVGLTWRLDRSTF